MEVKMINTNLFLAWLQAMKDTSNQFVYDEMYAAGALKAYQNVIDLINAGVFRDRNSKIP